MRVSDHFEKSALRYTNVEFAVFENLRMSYGEARKLVHAIATALCREKSISQGAVIGIYSSNHPRVPILQLGINRADFAWMGVHDRNAVEANAKVLDFMDCELVFFDSKYHGEIAELKAKNNKVRKWICIDSIAGEGLHSWLTGNYEEFPYAPPDMTRTACIVPTGGTTGESKGAVHTHYSLEQEMMALCRVFNMDAGSRVLSIAPLSHAAGQFALGFYPYAGTNVVMSGFDADIVLRLITEEKITHLFMPPTMVYALLAHPGVEKTDFSSIKVLLVGSAPIAPEKLKQAVVLFGPVIWESYAQSETLIPVTVKKPQDYILGNGGFDDSVLRSAGRSAEFVHAEIMDDDGNVVPRGVPGEIVVRMPSLMKGYYKSPDSTKESFAFGFHHTGDVGVMDEAGFITIVDRKKDMIVSGSFNVFPSEIEKVIYENAAVLDCVVVGVPHEKWGEAVKAVIQLKPGLTTSEDEIIANCRARLGSLKSPKSVEFWPELPRSPVGKLLRRLVRDKYWADQWRSV